MEVVIAGGGVAGLEALLALRAMAGDRVDLVARRAGRGLHLPAAGGGGAVRARQRPPRAAVAVRRGAGAELVIDAVVGVDDAAAARCGCATAARARSTRCCWRRAAARSTGVEGATTWWPGGDPEVYGGLLRDIEEGYAKRLAIVVPPGAVWPLPAYELALMTAGEARAMGHDDVRSRS